MPLSPEIRAQMEARLKEMLNETQTKSNSTRTVAENRRAFESSHGSKPKTSDLVARIEAAERVVWIPHSYVFFVRQATCRNCRTTSRCLDSPDLFLQQRKERRDDSNPYLYTPVKEIAFGKLPRRKILKIISVPVCEACYEGSTCPTIFSEKADTKLPIESTFQDVSNNVVIQMSHSGLPGQELTDSLSTKPLNQLFDSLLGVSDGSPSEMEFGSECGEREFAPRTATAEG